jgi:hypothetical protein
MLASLVLLLGGCDLRGVTDSGTPSAETPSNQTPAGTPGGGSSGTAKCAVSAQGVPQGVPVEALSVAEDAIAGYGNALNGFWKLNACVYRADPATYQPVTQNAISYNIPPVVIYDPALFVRFWNEWNSDLPTMLIVAHEWGYQVEYANNTQYQTTFEYEREADQRAGYYMGTQAQRDGSANVEQVAQLLKQFACSTGDPDGVPWFT